MWTYLHHTDAHSPSHSHSSHQKPTKNQLAKAQGGNSASPTKCKRPMNAFMLFAKKFRVEYTQMYPGKDNRWVYPVTVLSSSVVYNHVWYVIMCVSALQSDQRPPRRAVEENAKRGAPSVHAAGQSTRRRAEETQPRLLETQTNQLCKNTHSHTWFIAPEGNFHWLNAFSCL